MRFKVGKLPRTPAIFMAQKEKENRIQFILMKLCQDIFELDLHPHIESIQAVSYKSLQNINKYVKALIGSRKAELGGHCRKLYPTTRDMMDIIHKVFDVEVDIPPTLSKSEGIYYHITMQIMDIISENIEDIRNITASDKEEDKQSTRIICIVVTNIVKAYFKVFRKLPSKFGEHNAGTAEYELYHNLPYFITSHEKFSLSLE